MATDARGHTVPAASDVPSRTTLLNLALSMNDPVVVTNTTTRATLATAVSPTVNRPLVVYRVDARPDSALEYTTDGTTWRTVVIGSGVTAYTPTLTSSGTAPTMGAGATAAAEYEQFGDYVVGAGEIVAGTSGFAVGTGSYRILLPIAMTAAALAGGRVVGKGVFYDASASIFYHFLLIPTTTTTAALGLDGAFTQTPTVPVVPANTDQWRFDFMYRAA